MHPSFQDLQKIVQDRIGVDLGRTSSGQNILADEYDLTHLRTAPLNSAIWQRLVRALTIGESYFMRNQTHVEILRNELIPAHLLNTASAHAGIRIWCVGCSTGEEVYSVASLLAQFDLLDNPMTQIIGTDLNQQSLAVAREGRYRRWSFRETDEAFRQAYFTHDPDRDAWRVRETLRRAVRFQFHNLLTEPAPLQADLILCRNVLLYFDPASQDHAQTRLHQALNPGGWLLLGPSEALARRQRPHWRMGAFPGEAIYQRDDDLLKTREFAALSFAPEAGAEDSTTYEAALQAIHEADVSAAQSHMETLSRNQDPRVDFLRALIAADQQDYHTARRALSHYVDAVPLDPDAHYLHGLIEAEEQNITSAIRALQSALYCEPQHAPAYFQLGLLWLAQNQHEQAARCFRNALRIASAYPTTGHLSHAFPIQAGQLIDALQPYVAGSS